MSHNYYDPNQPSQSQYDISERQINFPGPGYWLGQIFGPGPGAGPGPGGFPGGGPFPGGFPGGPGGSPGGGGGQQSGPPTSPPPNFTPEQSQFQTFAIDPGGIRGCLFRFTYIWLRRDAFWFYPTFVGRTSIAGFRWTGFRWVYFGIDLNQIQSFQCF
ncbi:hypothetical protein ACS127_13815 [Amphibacillus sp. Q70]|uniref:hypothetical protein n=1 Tax=Amphibacillus sp. Q70 TaxID=3453416 RepID=UPI003F84AAAD